MASAPITITKIDAARRQAETAITLWFFDADAVSIHTLGSAALGILHDLGDRIGEPAMVFDPKYFREETFEEWKKAAKKAQNFFKHADKKNDPIAVHEFRPSSNEFLLSDCVDTYSRVTNERTPVMRVFWNYFMIHHPEYFQSIPIKPFTVELRSLPRAQFYNEALPVIQASGARTDNA
jgi:hypothetical protein